MYQPYNSVTTSSGPWLVDRNLISKGYVWDFVQDDSRLSITQELEPAMQAKKSLTYDKVPYVFDLGKITQILIILKKVLLY